MRDIFRSGAAYALSQIVERILTSITVVLLFQIASSKFIAQWNSFLLGSGIITSVITIGISVLVVKEFHTWSPSRRVKVLIKSYYFLLVIFFVFGIVGLIFPRNFESALFPSGSASSILYFFIAFAFVESLFEVSNSFLRAAEKFTTIALFNSLRSFTKLFSVAVFYSANTVVNLDPFLFLLLAEVILLVGSTSQLARPILENSSNDLFIKKETHELFNQQNILFIINYTLINLFYALITLADRYFVLHFLGDDAFSEYLFYIILVSPIVLIYTTINFVYSPRQAKIIHSHDLAFSMVKSNSPNLEIFFVTSSYTSGLIILLSSIAESVLGSERFVFDPTKFLLIATGMLLFGLHSLLSFTIILRNQGRKLFLILSVTAISSVVTNLILIQSLGNFGPFISGVIVNFILLVGTILVLKLNLVNIWELLTFNVAKLALRLTSFIMSYWMLSHWLVDDWKVTGAMLSIWLTIFILELRIFKRNFNSNES